MFALGAILLVLFSTLFYAFRQHGIPGPPRLPILGHLHLLQQMPHQSLTRIAQKYGPLVRLYLGSMPVLFISNSTMAKELLKTNDLAFASRPRNKTVELLNLPKDLILAPYGDYWRSLRTLCAQELLSDKNLATFQESRMKEVLFMQRQLLEASQRKVSVHIRDLLSEYSYNTLMLMLVGKGYCGPNHAENLTAEEFELFKKYKKMTQDMAFVTGQFHISDHVQLWGSNATPTRGLEPSVIDAFWKNVIQEHRLKESNDFLTTMLSVQSDEDRIKAFLQGLISAGTDAVSITVEWALAELLHHPKCMRQVQEELDLAIGRDSSLVQESDLDKLQYLYAVVKETFRLHPPVPMTIPHLSMENCKVGPFNIPAGTTAYVNIHAIGRDPESWKTPSVFFPDRFLNNDIDVRGHHFELLPFGAGRRGCPGSSLGVISVQLLLANLLHSFDWKLPEGGHSFKERSGIIAPLADCLEVFPSPRLCKC